MNPYDTRSGAVPYADGMDVDFSETDGSYPQEQAPYPRNACSTPQNQRPQEPQTEEPVTVNIIVKEIVCCVVAALLQGGLECLSRRRSRPIL